MANLWTGDQPKEFKTPHLNHGVGAGQQLLLLKGVDGGLLQHTLQPGAWVFNRRAEVDQLAAKAIAILPSTPLLVIVVLLIVCIIQVVVLIAKLFFMLMIYTVFIVMVICSMVSWMMMVGVGELMVGASTEVPRKQVAQRPTKRQKGDQPLLKYLHCHLYFC